MGVAVEVEKHSRNFDCPHLVFVRYRNCLILSPLVEIRFGLIGVLGSEIVVCMKIKEDKILYFEYLFVSNENQNVNLVKK